MYFFFITKINKMASLDAAVSVIGENISTTFLHQTKQEMSLRIDLRVLVILKTSNKSVVFFDM